MKFKFLPLILAAVCVTLSAVSCSESEDKKAERSVYCEAETNDVAEEEILPDTQSEIPEKVSAEETPTEEIPNDEAIETADMSADVSPTEESAEENAPPEEGQSYEATESSPSEQAETTPFIDESYEEAAETESKESSGAESYEAEISASKTEADVSDNTAAAVSETAQTQSEQAETPEEKAVYVKCICTDLNIRSGAGTEYTSLGKAEKGTLFAYLGTENGWYKTYYKRDYAYVSAYSGYTALVEIERGDEKTENVINEGLKLIGTKYVYGAVRLHDGKGNLLSGFTADEFDCSSLIQYIFYYGAGVILDVNTRTQIYEGEYVHPYSLQRGDCIYFTNSSRYNNSGVERVGHVALYLGDGYILHTASDYCKIEKISEARWNYYIEARRFI